MIRYLVTALLLAVPVVQAQSWPQKPVRVIVPFAPGGATPMPPLVATAPLKPVEVEKLRNTFLRAHQEPSLSSSLKTLLVERFVVPELSVYDETRRRAERVDEAPEWP